MQLDRPIHTHSHVCTMVLSIVCELLSRTLADMHQAAYFLLLLLLLLPLPQAALHPTPQVRLGEWQTDTTWRPAGVAHIQKGQSGSCYNSHAIVHALLQYTQHTALCDRPRQCNKYQRILNAPYCNLLIELSNLISFQMWHTMSKLMLCYIIRPPHVSIVQRVCSYDRCY